MSLSCSVRAAIAAVSLFAASEGMAATCPEFGGPTPYGAGTAPQSVATGDFNRDGRPDLAVADSSSGEISVLLRDNAGGFEAAVPYTAQSWPYAIVAADFSRDGNLDLVVANRDS